MTPAPFASGMMGVVAVFGMLAPSAVEGHGFCIEPISRQYLRSKEFNDGDEYYVEKWAGSFNGGGADAVQARTIDNIDPDILADYGGGDVWIVGAAWDKGERCPNNNYLESDKIAVGHGVCGDPPQGGLDNPNTYSTPNTLWPPISTYQSGSIIELKAVINNNHWGHIEYFLCDTADMDDPDGVVTQDCLNMYPLDRDETDWWNSPIDPDYPGRFFVNPECRGETGETDQTGRPMLNDGEVGLDNGYINVGRYHLPNIQCEHCVLQMKYYAYVGCHHPGYHEFEPEWPGDCAPDKEEWLPHKNPGCSDEGQKWGNVFFGCSDITLVADGETSSTAPAAPTPDPEPEPTPEPTPESTPESTPEVTSEPTPESTPESTPETTPEPTPEATPEPTRELEPTAEPIAEPEQPVAAPVYEMPVAMPVEEGYSYVGCFADSKDDRVFEYMKTSSTMTTAVCLEYCLDRRATYMATQYGYECWCSVDAEVEYDRHSDGMCDHECGGDAADICGGFDAFDLYKITEPTEPTGDEYVGCFADDREDRLLGDEIKLQSDMTQAVCRTYCEERDAYFYATQYGDECWCGMSEDEEDYKRHGRGSCLAGCSGDPTVACGGVNAFNLFKFDGIAEPVAPTPEPVATTRGPVAAPTPGPVVEPTPGPVVAPTPGPVIEPTPGPVVAPTPEPVAAPTPTNDCMVVIIEAEDLPVNGDWRIVQDNAASGGAYITWEGLSEAENNSDPADGDIISTSVQIPIAGTYSFKWAMRQPDGVESDKANDSWLNFPDADRFGPAGTSKSYGTFVKVYGNAADGVFKYQGTAEEENGDHTQIAIEFAAAGEYEMEIGGRSHGHQIDQIVLFGDSLKVDDAVAGC